MFIHIVLCIHEVQVEGVQLPPPGIHSFLVATSVFIKKKPCTTNHSNFIYPCKVNIFQATNHKLKNSVEGEHFLKVVS